MNLKLYYLDQSITNENPVFFLADRTSTANKDFQIATQKNFSLGFATLISSEKFIETIKNWK